MNLKASGRNIEVACFSAGCNLRCSSVPKLNDDLLWKRGLLTEEAASLLPWGGKREEVIE
jgi:hypothetical protein